MQVLIGHFGVDFPLADFLTEAPDKAFLTGVTAGREVNTVTIDGVYAAIWFFRNRQGIELELWLEENDQSLPRRLIVTYRSLPGKPNFVAEISNWDFRSIRQMKEFTFKPPEGAKQVDFGAVTGALHPGAPQ